MMSDRLFHLQSLLEKHYRQLAGQEEAKLLAEDAEKIRIQQKIDKMKTEIASVEREYWRCWQIESTGLTLPEAEAEIVATQLVQQVEFLEFEPAVQSNTELLSVLQEIKAVLSQPETPATGKLKAAIPLLPGVLTYEMELNTAGLLQRAFPTFCQLANQLKRKK